MKRAILGLLIGCHVTSATQVLPDAAAPPSDAAPDTAVATPLALSCSATAHAYLPNPCPALVAGKASFCFRPGWPGVTAVDVYGAFNNWTAPYLSLSNDGSGTFSGTSTLADGTYPYVFGVHGADDSLVRDGTYLDDPENGAFEPAPTGSPIQRSVSVLTMPQVAQPLRHVRGTVVYAGVPQPCFAVSLEVGELLNADHSVRSEHGTSNFIEVGPDGTYDFPVADGPIMAALHYPFLLAGPSTPYPDPRVTPSIGYARTTMTVAGADLALDPLDVAYAPADYAAMSPVNGSGTLPQTFTYTLLAGMQTASVAVIATNTAGNDPAYWSAFATTTSLSWNGTFGNGTHAASGTKYWWGTWQRAVGPTTTWSEESLLFPITF